MPETFYIYQRAVDVRPLEDGLFAIFNDETSDDRRYFARLERALDGLALDHGQMCALSGDSRRPVKFLSPPPQQT